MRKLLFVNSPNRTSEPPRHYPYGLVILTTILKRNGYEVDVFDGNLFSLENLSEHLHRNRYDFIGISGLITTFSFQKCAAEISKKFGKGAIIASGGGLASAIGGELLKLIPSLNIVFEGEAERSLLSFLAGNETELPIRSDIKYIVTGKMEKELDTIPIPDLSDWGVEKYFEHGSFPLSPSISSAKRRANVLTSRGCPFHCDFCFNGLGRQSIRYRTVDNVIKEIEELIAKYRIDFISFLDESFLINKSRAIELAERIKERELNVRWGVAARSTSVDGELLKSIAGAGCDFIYYGFDSGSPETLDRMNKRMTIEDNIRAFVLSVEAGIIPVPNIIIGYDNETMRNIEENYDFFNRLIESGKALKDGTARELFTIGFNNFGAIYFATPYPGSELYLRNRDRLPPLGEILQRISGKDAYELTINVSSIPDDILRTAQKRMEMTVRGFRL